MKTGAVGWKRWWPFGGERKEERLIVGAEGVRRVLADGREESVLWSELVRVAILTTDQGPFGEDFFFLLHARDGTGCAVPNQLAQGHALLARLQQLPRFDSMAVIVASGCCDDAMFECWSGEPGEGLAAATEASGQSLGARSCSAT